MSVGQDDLRQLAGLIGHVREADDERHLADRVGELESRRERERGVDTRTQDEDLDLAAAHRARQRGDFRVRRDLAVGRIRAEAHGLADVTRRRVEQIDRDL